MPHRRRRRWQPPAGLENEERTLANTRRAIVECLVQARGGTYDEQERYLRDVLARVGADGEAGWAELYLCLAQLRQDALDEGEDPRVVQENVTKLQRLLERVED